MLRQIGIVSQSEKVSFSELTRVSAALSKQVARDFGPIWEVQATVDTFRELQDVPLGYWPIVVKDNIGFNAAGIHLDKNNQPFALVTASTDWSLTASHETLEMLADPFGNRLMAGDSPMSSQGRVEFLVEVADPSEAAQFGYTVNSILVSDFYTPHYFDPIRGAGVRYSFTGAITEPRQVRPGGYLSWRDPVADQWFQETFFTGSQPQFRPLGRLSSNKASLRAQIDELTNKEALRVRFDEKVDNSEATVLRGDVRMMSRRADESTVARADGLQKEIDAITGGAVRGRQGETVTEEQPSGRSSRSTEEVEEYGDAGGRRTTRERGDTPVSGRVSEELGIRRPRGRTLFNQ